MTPAVDNWDGKKGSDLTNWKYQNKIKAMIALIQQNIPGVAVQVVPYKRLNYSNNNGNLTGPDRNIIGINARGMAFFQYNGTTDRSY
ncbi:hypothetical protein QBC46DRAFT_344760 [Diplogelasinospora grovesii]|uniref:Uncharacterized protein n=1 Tax=Diplogelasinospora grovesii TaxID=303347 RepID=A0AAN6N2Q9_9PEZI|nr:hypothetical protein QBC46DRAFT_344760 [Diplogelasinospora grovesii]